MAGAREPRTRLPNFRPPQNTRHAAPSLASAATASRRARCAQARCAGRQRRLPGAVGRSARATRSVEQDSFLLSPLSPSTTACPPPLRISVACVTSGPHGAPLPALRTGQGPHFAFRRCAHASSSPPPPAVNLALWHSSAGFSACAAPVVGRASRAASLRSRADTHGTSSWPLARQASLQARAPKNETDMRTRPCSSCSLSRSFLPFAHLSECPPQEAPPHAWPSVLALPRSLAAGILIIPALRFFF